MERIEEMNSIHRDSKAGSYESQHCHFNTRLMNKPCNGARCVTGNSKDRLLQIATILMFIGFLGTFG